MAVRGAAGDHVEALVRATGRRGAATVAVGVSVRGARTLARWAPRAAPSTGAARVAGQRPAPPTFEIGSLAKPLTGALLADMHLRGELALGDRLAMHLPYAAGWPAGEATLEQLATHRSGLPNTPRSMLVRELALLAGIRRSDPWSGVDERAYHALVSRMRPRLPRQRSVRYSSIGFGLLGDALAWRAGRSYGDLLRERLLEPLGMRDTSVAGPTSLRGRSRRGRPRPAMHHRMIAAGGVRSTATDVLRWLEACLRPSAEPPGPALALAQRPRARAARRVGLGLGWIVLRAHRSRPAIVWHNGLTYGFRSFAAFVPDAGIAVVALANATGGLERLGFNLIDVLLARERADLRHAPEAS